MTFLIIGVLLWFGAHLIPVYLPTQRQAVIDRSIGEGPYKGLFSLVMLSALGAIIYGWRHSIPELIYLPPSALKPVGMSLMPVAVGLFIASSIPTRLNRVVRHPQLTSVILWSAAHLMMKGDSRSLVLFGGLGLWALVAMIGTNRRDGEWQKPEPPPVSREIIWGIVTIAVYIGLVFGHPWIAGVPVT